MPLELLEMIAVFLATFSTRSHRSRLAGSFSMIASRIQSASFSLPRSSSRLPSVISAARAAQEVAQQGGPAKVLVNIGGDLRHLSTSGQRGIAVDVMDPHAPFANAAPLTRLMLNQGLATSGGAFRGFVVAGQRFTHLLDPCSGQPVRQVIGATVLAPRCADADALATAFSVLDPAYSLALADRLPGVACLLVLEDGQQRRSSRFAALDVP